MPGKIEKKRQPRRLSMQVKLNAMVICSILLVAAGLMTISYYVFCQRVDDKYNDSLHRAAEACANNVDYETLAYFWSKIDTEEFRAVHERAAKANDETPIADWMNSQPGWVAAEDDRGEPASEIWSLMDDYELIRSGLTAIMEYFETDSAYYQYCEGNVTYNIADPDEGLLYIGTIEEPIAEEPVVEESAPQEAAPEPVFDESMSDWYGDETFQSLMDSTGTATRRSQRK